MISMQTIINDIKAIKPFNKTTTKIISMLNNDDIGLKSIAEILRYDPVLTMLVLKAVNSSNYIHRTYIKDVATAINYLGRKTVKNLVLIASTKPYFNRTLEGYEAQEGEILEQAISTAVIAEHISSNWQDIDVDCLYTSALLHDIGKIVLSQYVNNKYTKINEEVESGLDFLSAEKKILGFNHCDIGASLLKIWGFKESAINTAKYHHTPLETDDIIVHIVAIADYIAMITGRVSQFDSLNYSGYTELLIKYNIKRQDLERIISGSLEKIEKIKLLIKE